MKLEIINENGIEKIKMFRIGFYSKQFCGIKYTPFFTTKEKAIEHYKRMCKMKVYEKDKDFYISEHNLYA